MELGDIAKSRKQKNSKVVPLAKVAEESAAYQVLTPQQLEKEISKLEAAMYQHAQNLEFELAAQNVMKFICCVSSLSPIVSLSFILGGSCAITRQCSPIIGIFM